MTKSNHYDTVAFDVRDNAAMLFFAVTADSGDIKNYLLLMRDANEELSESIYLEIDEEQRAGEDVIVEAELTGNVLTLRLHPEAQKQFACDNLIVTFDDNDTNRAGIEAGAFRVLGAKLTGGHS